MDHIRNDLIAMFTFQMIKSFTKWWHIDLLITGRYLKP